MTVLLAENERLKGQIEDLNKEKTNLYQEKIDIEAKLRTDYIPR